MRTIFILPIVMFALIAGFFGWALYSNRDPSTLPSMLIDKPMPNIVLAPLLADRPGIDPARIAAGGSGPVTLLNIFASWCPPCQVEHPVLLKLSRDPSLKDKIRIVGINYKDKPDEAKAWLARLGNPYDAIGSDLNGRASIDWGSYGVPETYVIDRNGRVRYRQVGPITEDVWHDTLAPIVERLQAGPPK
jgi:cytochrome c biogenesis protein CcmG/thiol:disulfide interchange protein DsbE